MSNAGYFKAIHAAKNKHWSSFLLGATPQSLWTAKRFPYGRTPPFFLSLPGADTSPRIRLGYHPASLKGSNGIVLDKQGKPTYESPASFRIIVLIRIFSKILERIISSRLLLVARLKGRLHPNHCGSLPGLSTYDAVLTLFNNVKTLQRSRLKVSSLFLDIKAGFDNVDNSTLARILREGGIPPYLVSWVSSFLGEWSCTLVFQGAPGTPGLGNVGAPQGSPISPVLFLLYVAPLYFKIPRGLMISYVDDFALTAASPSYRGNIHRLQMLFEKLEAKALRLGVPFSVAKPELIHWRTPSQRHSPKCLSPIQIKGLLFCLRDSVRWLGYWFTPALDSSAHFSPELALAQGAFVLIRHLSPPSAGLAPYLCHRLATFLIAPILLYSADLLTPSARAMAHLNTFWHKVQRWTTNCFSATPKGILAVESCLPPVPLLISQ